VTLLEEGLRNRIRATPALFLDGREYAYDLEARAIVDVVEELAERLR
jgi:hypothetical protein